MPEEVKIWKIMDGDRLEEIRRTKLDLENRLEQWLENDISIISNNLLIIGRQVRTEFGGEIDLLCLERNGDAVVVELKSVERHDPIFEAQILSYMKLGSYKLGLLINFNSRLLKNGIKRLII